MTETIENLRDFNYYKFNADLKCVLAEYIWIDGTGEKLRSKTKVYQNQIKSLEDLEWWTYDGSSTDQAVTRFSEIYLKPVCMVTDPFRNAPHLLVLCEAYLMDKKTPARFNFRYSKMTRQIIRQPHHGISQRTPTLVWHRVGVLPPQEDWHNSFVALGYISFIKHQAGPMEVSHTSKADTIAPSGRGTTSAEPLQRHIYALV